MRAKVMFYFVIRKGKGLVLTAGERADLRLSEEKGQDTGAGAAYPTIDEAEWRRLAAATTAPVLLDIRDRRSFARRHLDGAVNIPENELSSRAEAELSKTRQLVIDCPLETRDLCSWAARILQRAGFTRVAMLSRQ
jgi:rhodanese-related sulfurtransferase